MQVGVGCVQGPLWFTARLQMSIHSGCVFAAGRFSLNLLIVIDFFFQQIVGYPSTKVLTSEEKDLLWQFRFYLTNQKKVNGQ